MSEPQRKESQTDLPIRTSYIPPRLLIVMLRVIRIQRQDFQAVFFFCGCFCISLTNNSNLVES